MSNTDCTNRLSRRDALAGAAGLAAFSLLGTAAGAAPFTGEPTMDPALRDFDFLMGTWKVFHRRLKARLVGNNEWEDFDGTLAAHKVMGGQGNIDDNVLNLPSGSYRAFAVRSFDPKTRTWAIWWLDARTPHTFDPPVVGTFENYVGTFYADDVFNGRPIKVRFRWTRTDTPTPGWEQAFSPDGGATWETNWVMSFARQA